MEVNSNKFIRREPDNTTFQLRECFLGVVANDLPDNLLTAGKRWARATLGASTNQRENELNHISWLVTFYVLDMYFRSTMVLLAETKTRDGTSYFHHCTCQEQLERSRGNLKLVNADLYLPSITEDSKGNKASKIGECCQGLVNLELMIYHLSSLDNVEKNQMYVDLSAVKSDDDIIRVVSGKSLLKIISRIHSAAAMAVFDAGEERNDTYIAFVNKAYNNLAKLKVDLMVN